MNELNDTTTSLAPTLAPLEVTPRLAFDRLREMGFRFVQLSAAQPGLRPRELDGSARRDLAATLRRKELGVSGLDAWIPAGHFIDAATVDRAAAAMIDAIDLAADLGRCPVSVLLPPAEEDEPDADLAPVIGSLIDHAQHVGVELVDHALPVAQRGGMPVGIDPAAWLAAGEDPSSGIAAHAGKLISIRLCDLLTSGLRGPVGDRQEGRLDVTAYRVAVNIAGFTRPVVVDARQWRDAWSGLIQTARAWEAAGPAGI